MTLKEQLVKVREIHDAAPDEHNACGCLEDAICRVYDGGSWFPRYDPQNHGLPVSALGAYGTNRTTNPMYVALMTSAQKLFPLMRNSVLWGYNDQLSKKERLAIIDHAIAEVPA